MRRPLRELLAPRMLALLIGLAGLAAPADGLAADLKVTVVGAAGKPVADAVVMVRRSGSGGEAIRFPWPLVVEQRQMQFHPFVLIVPVGSEVAFPNHDSFRHHVYSFSPAKTFELKLYGHEETRRVRFNRPGVVALGCNIHDDMSAFIRVVDTPFAAKSDGRGEAVIHDLPPGPATLSAWHPYLRGGRDLVREIAVAPAGGAMKVTLDLGPAPMKRGGY